MHVAVRFALWHFFWGNSSKWLIAFEQHVSFHRDWGNASMKNLCVLMLCICVVIISFNPVWARDKFKRTLVPMESLSDNASLESVDPGLRALLETAAVDSYCIVWYDFEPKSWQGWTRVDYTARDTFFHVDDFYALGGGDFGRLVPIQGAKSMWCGTRTSSNTRMSVIGKRRPATAPIGTRFSPRTR